MSIVVSVKVRDGLILGSDSMSQIYMKDDQGVVAVAQTFSNARKLFQVSKLPIGVMTYGAGNIGPRSTQGLIEDFSELIGSGESNNTDSVEKVAGRLLVYFNEAYDLHLADVPEEERPTVGVFVAGYSLGEPFPEEWEFQVPAHPRVMPVRSKESFGASWRGVALPFTRLYMGFDPRIRDRLKELGVDEKILGQAMEPFKCPVAYDAMPVQDAINFTHHILRTTVDHTTFEIGPPACGGPLDIAVITRVDGFKIITERKLMAPAN